jgi:hypothetical protein
MEENKPNPGQALSAEQIENISGGDATSCPAPITIGPITVPPPVGNSFVQIYEGFVEVTSHIIERVANATR